MGAKRAKGTPPAADPATAAYEEGWSVVRCHPMFSPLSWRTIAVRREGNLCPKDSWAVVTSNGYVHVHPTRRGEPEEWAYVLAHCLLHLGFGHFREREQPAAWNAACDLFIGKFLADLKLGRPPDEYLYPVPFAGGSEERLYAGLCERGVWAGYRGDLVAEPPDKREWRAKIDWAAAFGQGLAEAVTSAVEVAAGEADHLGAPARRSSRAQRARAWFVNSYPLLGALAASFTIVEDPKLCARLGISVAAVDTESREIFINPAAGLSEGAARFVMAHELLHVGLRHDIRRQGRDPFLWNVACFPAGTWTSQGLPIEALATMRRPYAGELVEINCQGGRVACTPEHPFLARRRQGRSYPIRVTEPAWIPAEELRVGDYLLVPCLPDKTAATEIDLRPYIRDGTDRLGRRTFGNRALKSIPLDPDTAWLIGLYVAEGSATSAVLFSLGAHETPLIERITQIARHIGTSASVQVQDTRAAVSLGVRVFGRWLREQCGRDARTKHIPRVILTHEDHRIRSAFLEGLVAGDGHVHRQSSTGQLQAMVGSVSERLIADVALLLAQDGFGGSRGLLRRGPRQIGKRWTERELTLHTFHWNPAGVAASSRRLNGKVISSHSHRWRADAHGVWYRIRAVRRTPFEGTVYNLSTPDHTYIANAFLVHNCDYVINGWLVEMGLGEIPEFGGLHDPALKGESAEAIYDRIVTDFRRYRKLATLRGVGLSDILERRPPDWWASGAGADLDDFYRSCLAQGLTYHEGEGRGLLPAGLVEEIRALSQPPIPWDVALARWFDHHFPPPERVRSYARLSRRQSATPDIPRPRLVIPPAALDARTFGVALDTSGSMDRTLLAKALGAIAAYSLAHEVPAARVVFCDATTYDQGYLPVEDIAGRVRVRGRGGTVLQPAIDLLERAPDFPKDGPVLIITDGFCDRLTVRREHAYLLPKGRTLPFPPRGEVFRIS
jgi:predicted metal-dependent peptidase